MEQMGDTNPLCSLLAEGKSPSVWVCGYPSILHTSDPDIYGNLAKFGYILDLFGSFGYVVVFYNNPKDPKDPRQTLVLMVKLPPHTQKIQKGPKDSQK